MDDDDSWQYLALQIPAEEYAGQLDDPSSYIHEVKGSIVVHCEPGGETPVIGEFACTMVDADSARTHGISPYELYDTHQATWNLYEALLGHDGPNARLLKALRYEWLFGSLNLLSLDRLTVLPQARGHKVGLMALGLVMQRFLQFGDIVVLKPFPLQFEGSMADDEAERYELGSFSCTKDYGTRRLARYYAELGFRKVARTEYMARLAKWPLPYFESERYFKLPNPIISGFPPSSN